MSIPYLMETRIAEIAYEILADHGKAGVIPIDVEKIVEISLGMEIRPVRGQIDRFGFEGALSKDLNTIFVDADQQAKNLNRYRFTVAHELGHRVLHGAFIQSLEFGIREEWKSSVTTIPPSDYAKLEAQAYIFAGHLLVPVTPLRNICEAARLKAVANGIDLNSMGETAISYVAGNIAKQFKVSTAVIERRLQNESIFGRGQ